MWSIHLTSEAKDTKVYSNRSVAYMKLGKPQQVENTSWCTIIGASCIQALVDAESVISLEPEWSKGYFRKGQALAGIVIFEPIESDFRSLNV